MLTELCRWVWHCYYQARMLREEIKGEFNLNTKVGNLYVWNKINSNLLLQQHHMTSTKSVSNITGPMTAPMISFSFTPELLDDPPPESTASGKREAKMINILYGKTWPYITYYVTGPLN